MGLGIQDVGVTRVFVSGVDTKNYVSKECNYKSDFLVDWTRWDTVIRTTRLDFRDN